MRSKLKQIERLENLRKTTIFLYPSLYFLIIPLHEQRKSPSMVISVTSTHFQSTSKVSTTIYALQETPSDYFWSSSRQLAVGLSHFWCISLKTCFQTTNHDISRIFYTPFKFVIWANCHHRIRFCMSLMISKVSRSVFWLKRNQKHI